MLAQHYAQALYLSVRGKEEKWEEYVKNLVLILKQRGHSKLLPSILKEYKKLLEQKEDISIITVSRLADKKALEEAQKVSKMHFHDMESEVSVNENIIGGFQVLSSTKMVDASYKTALRELYRNMIA